MNSKGVWGSTRNDYVRKGLKGDRAAPKSMVLAEVEATTYYAAKPGTRDRLSKNNKIVIAY
jgi:hypothetical protein